MPRGSKPLLTPAQDQEVVAKYRSGMTVRQIAAEFSVSYTPIAAALKRCGEARRTTSDYWWQPTHENRAEVVRLWHEGLGVQKIARTVGTGNDVVSRVLRDAGVATRFGGQNHRFKKDQVAQLVADHTAGVSLAELARRHSCSTTVVRNTLKRAGVEIQYHGRVSRFWTPERVAWLREQHEAGRSQESIARELGYSQSAIGRKMRDLKLVPVVLRLKGPEHGAWKGGRRVDSQGYVHVYVSEDEQHLVRQTISGGYALEHRLVMARMLGRPLAKHETVHHVNGDKQDNSPENLQLRQGRHGKGVRVCCLDCGSSNVEAIPLD